ncbi:MAG TPA: hypothetical protein VGI88_13450 [Verrucomicrobiae bacterium]|jgi:hypothetical protein
MGLNNGPSGWKWIKMISIGAIFGGGELAGAKIDRLIHRFCSALPPVQDPNFPDINIVFHVPGSIVKPDYSGIRTGKFSAKSKTLMIQVAVPESLKDSPELESFLHESIIEAIAVAKMFFEKKKVQFIEKKYLSVIEEMQKRLQIH